VCWGAIPEDPLNMQTSTDNVVAAAAADLSWSCERPALYLLGTFDHRNGKF
jgi:hypothetical protein